LGFAKCVIYEDENMRSQIARRIYDETPAEVKIFVRKYGDVVVRVHRLLKEKGCSQNDLGENLEKTPWEVSKWINGDHNFTLRGVAKLEAELGSEILVVPQKDSFHGCQLPVSSGEC
jgi:hypothetical protein